MSIIANVQFHVYTVLWFSSSFLLGSFRQKSVHKEQKNCFLWTLFCLRGCWAVFFFFSKIMIAFLHFCVSEIFFHCSNYLLLMHRFAHVNVVRVKWDQTRKPAITTQTVTRKSNQSELGTLKKKKSFFLFLLMTSRSYHTGCESILILHSSTKENLHQTLRDSHSDWARRGNWKA